MPDVNSGESPDPLLHHEPLPLDRIFWPLGFPVLVRTNSEIVLGAAAESWGQCKARFEVKPVEVRAGVHGPEGGPVPPMPVYRSYDHLLTITASPNDSAVCDLRKGRSYSWVTPAALTDLAYYRYTFLEAMAYLQIAAFYLAPIHCAAVVFGGHGVLLCGESGAGKSSLAFACARRGWTYVCDDAAYLVRGKAEAMIVGASFSIRLRKEATQLFPEMEAYTAKRHPTGAIRLEIRTADIPGFQTADEATVRHIVFLDRQTGAEPRLRSMSRDDAFAEFTSNQPYGPKSMHEAWNETYKHLLTSASISRFTYSTLDAAIDRLEKVVREGNL